jgi:hypothetical protein
LTILQDNSYKKIPLVTLCKFWHRTYTCLYLQRIQNLAQDHVWILHKQRSRYFTFQFFKQKLKLKSIYMLWESCSSSHREHNKIGFAFFLFFLRFYKHFTSRWTELKYNLVKDHHNQVPNSQICPRPSQQCPEGGRRARRRWGGARGRKQASGEIDWTH